MKGEPSCPRCGHRVRAPGDPLAHLPVVPESLVGAVPDTVPENLSSLPAAALPLGADSAVDLWHCELHGAVHPVQPVLAPDPETLLEVGRHSQVPLWLPWPLPGRWRFSGLAYAGDRFDGARATVVAASGPSPFGGGESDLLLIAEEMGIGIGARFAGLPGPDPGPIFEDTAAHAKVYAAGRPTPMWAVPGTGDRAVFVGEARGMWLWVVLWPEIAGTLLYDEVVLTDLRDALSEVPHLPMGTLCPRFFA